MPSKRRPVKKVTRVPKSRRVDVTRAEFDRVLDLLNERGKVLNDLRENHEMQFKRIAQIQAELDRVTHGLLTLSERVDQSRRSA
jgi:hypothetical protein